MGLAHSVRIAIAIAKIDVRERRRRRRRRGCTQMRCLIDIIALSCTAWPGTRCGHAESEQQRRRIDAMPGDTAADSGRA